MHLVGKPFDIASDALRTHIVAQATGLRPGGFVHTLGDADFCHNHLDQARLQLERKALPLPRLVLNRQVRDLFAFRFEDIAIAGYEAHGPIAAPVAV